MKVALESHQILHHFRRQPVEQVIVIIIITIIMVHLFRSGVTILPATEKTRSDFEDAAGMGKITLDKSASLKTVNKNTRQALQVVEEIRTFSDKKGAHLPGELISMMLPPLE